jgi:hypothetical protein
MVESGRPAPRPQPNVSCTRTTSDQADDRSFSSAARIVGGALFTTRPSLRSRLLNITLNRPGPQSDHCTPWHQAANVSPARRDSSTLAQALRSEVASSRSPRTAAGRRPRPRPAAARPPPVGSRRPHAQLVPGGAASPWRSATSSTRASRRASSPRSWDGTATPPGSDLRGGRSLPCPSGLQKWGAPICGRV